MAEKFKEWIKSAWSFQQEMYKTFCKRKWDDVPTSDLLKKKIELAFGYRFGENYPNITDLKSKVKHIEEQLLKLFDDKKFNQGFDFTFINIKMKDDEKDQRLTTCLFWLQDDEGKVKCLDLDGRNYDSFDEFIENNVFPDCYMMYPNCGRYYHSYFNGEEDFAEMILEESVSCGIGRTVKRTFDVLTTIGGIAGAGVLLCNPVSGPVILGAAVTSAFCGFYSAGNNISRLADIQKHEGGLALDSKTLLTAGELVVNVAGSAAIGVTAGIKGFAAASGTVLNEGSLALKLANNATKITRVVSCFNSGYNFIVVINNYSINGKLTFEDKLRLTKALFYGFNIFLTEALVTDLFYFLVNNLSVENIVQNFLINRGMKIIVRKFYNYACKSDLPELLEKLFPDSFKKYFQKFNNFKPMVDISLDIVSSTMLILKEKNLNCLNIIHYLHGLQENLLSLLKKYDEYKKETENELSNKLSIKASDHFIQRTVNGGIDLFENDSRFDQEINSLFEIHENIKQILKVYFKYETEQCEINEKELFSQLCYLVKKGNLNGGDKLFVNKMYFFCNSFETLCKTNLELYNFEYFLYKTIKKTRGSINHFVLLHYKIPDLRKHIYNVSLDLLRDNVESLHKEFDNKFQNTERTNERKERIFYELMIPNCNSWLKKEVFYKKAQELLPNLKEKLNEDSTTFDEFENLNMALINSKKREFVIFFYAVIEDNNLKGFLLFDENLPY